MPMTHEGFRQLALALPGAVESAHMDHPDFRVNGRVFASLGYPDDDSGMVRVPPKLQQALVQQAPAVFQPCAGAWGRQGCTSVRLAAVQAATLNSVLSAAFLHAAAAQKKQPKAATE